MKNAPIFEYNKQNIIYHVMKEMEYRNANKYEQSMFCITKLWKNTEEEGDWISFINIFISNQTEWFSMVPRKQMHKNYSLHVIKSSKMSNLPSVGIRLNLVVLWMLIW